MVLVVEMSATIGDMMVSWGIMFETIQPTQPGVAVGFWTVKVKKQM